MCYATRRVHPYSLFCCVWLWSEMFVLEFLLDCFYNVVADKFLRLLVFEDVATSFNADFCHAFNVILENAHHILQCLFIRLLLCFKYPLFYFIH